MFALETSAETTILIVTIGREINSGIDLGLGVGLGLLSESNQPIYYNFLVMVEPVSSTMI